MKMIDVSDKLHEKAEAGDTVALAALLIAYNIAELDDRLMAIDGVLTEIRSTLQENG